MTDPITFRLKYIVLGYNSPTDIEINARQTVGCLKKVIRKECAYFLEGIDAQALSLWKPKECILFNPIKDLHTRLPSSDQSTYAIDLDTLEEDGVAAIYSELLPAKTIDRLQQEIGPFEPPKALLDVSKLDPKCIHIVVQKPDTVARKHSSHPPHPLYVAQRSETVAALYYKLCRHHFIQVRGTPASGKTTLAKLLGQHIKKVEPEVSVIWLGMWLKDEIQPLGWEQHLTNKGWSPHVRSFLIFDEAQTSYWDLRLWNELFKAYSTFGPIHIIIFASYGSPTSVDVGNEFNPWSIPPMNRITLRPIFHGGDSPAIGLFYTRLEADSVVQTQNLVVSSTIIDGIYNLTLGHAAAFRDTLDIVCQRQGYREVRTSNPTSYTWTSFWEDVTPTCVFGALSDGICSRGLPQLNDLRRKDIASVLLHVLREGILLDGVVTGEEERALKECYRKGWLHSDGTDGGKQFGYVFASPLHRLFVEWSFTEIHHQPNISADNLLQFTLQVVRLFSPQKLSTPRRIGPGCVQRPPEAVYQDEFNRCCHVLLEGSVVTFPEFGNGQGRIDLYIPHKQWGIEILRDGHQLSEHSGRFSTSGNYQQTIPTSEYIILDFCSTRPRVARPSLKHLYHVVFSASYDGVQILDNNLKVEKSGDFRLLASS